MMVGLREKDDLAKIKMAFVIKAIMLYLELTEGKKKAKHT
jgi:hypothetical protein